MKIKNATFYFAADIVEKLIPFILIPIEAISFSDRNNIDKMIINYSNLWNSLK